MWNVTIGNFGESKRFFNKILNWGNDESCVLWNVMSVLKYTEGMNLLWNVRCVLKYEEGMSLKSDQVLKIKNRYGPLKDELKCGPQKIIFIHF